MKNNYNKLQKENKDLNDEKNKNIESINNLKIELDKIKNEYELYKTNTNNEKEKMKKLFEESNNNDNKNIENKNKEIIKLG